MAFVVSFSGFVHAQEKKHEIGINLLSMGEGSRMTNWDFERPFGGPTVFSGLHYKRIFNHHALRAALSVTQNSYISDPNRYWTCYDCIIPTVGNVGGVKLQMGYEVFAKIKRLEPYAAMDAFLSFNEYKARFINYPGENSAIRRTHRLGAGIAPILGFRVRISPSFYVSADASLNFGFYHHNSRREDTLGKVNGTKYTYDQLQPELISINSLSLNYRF